MGIGIGFIPFRQAINHLIFIDNNTSMFYSNIFLAIILAFAPMLARSEIPDLKIASGSAFQQGIVKLEWSANSEVRPTQYELQQAMEANFSEAKTIYQGTDEATFLSGLNNGTYHYRLRSDDGRWSETISVDVEHHSLNLALVLMAIGATVFLIILGVIIQGSRNQKSI